MKKFFKVLSTYVLAALLLSAIGTTEMTYALNSTSSDEAASLTEVSDEMKKSDTEDVSLPFTEKPDGYFTGNSIVVMFKYDYSEEYVENVIKPELVKLAGEDQFSELKLLMNCSCEDQADRLIYCISFNFNDKEKIYSTAVDFYNTGYFYSVEMDYIPIPAGDDTSENTTADESLPFVEKTDGIYFGDKLFGTFKYDYSQKYIETVIQPELEKLVGDDEFSGMTFISGSDEGDGMRSKYVIRFNFDDKEKLRKTAEDFCNTGYFYSVENVPVVPDESLPFTEDPTGDFIGNKLIVMFKSEYSKAYIETVLKQELIKLIGEEDFSDMEFLMMDMDNWSERLMYGVIFNFDDKEKAYKAAVDLYNTGYFYFVEMNHKFYPAVDDAESIPDGTEYGDVNDDGVVNISDVVALNLYLLNKEKYPLGENGIANADCVRDNLIDVNDVTVLTNYVAEIIEKSLLGTAH